VFHATIENLLDVSVNSIPESAVHNFYYTIVDGTGLTWYSLYRGNDIDGGGLGLVNPLDLLSPTNTNDSVDGHSGGQDTIDIRRMTTLHELGHAIGMGPGNTHDNMTPSPMVEGHGPYNISTFRNQDKAQFRLK
jgi:hypothetical protein